MVIGIGGHIGYPDGFLPIPFLQGIFPYGWPAIATGAVAGVLLNGLFTLVRPPAVHRTIEPEVEPSAAD